jgi:hypothetical protein
VSNLPGGMGAISEEEEEVIDTAKGEGGSPQELWLDSKGHEGGGSEGGGGIRVESVGRKASDLRTRHTLVHFAEGGGDDAEDDLE